MTNMDLWFLRKVYGRVIALVQYVSYIRIWLSWLPESHSESFLYVFSLFLSVRSWSIWTLDTWMEGLAFGMWLELLFTQHRNCGEREREREREKPASLRLFFFCLNFGFGELSSPHFLSLTTGKVYLESKKGNHSFGNISLPIYVQYTHRENTKYKHTHATHNIHPTASRSNFISRPTDV